MQVVVQQGLDCIDEIMRVRLEFDHEAELEALSESVILRFDLG